MVCVLCPALAVPAVIHAASGSGAGGPARPVREPTRQERSALHRAEQILLRNCMRRHGFEYRMVAENPVPQAREFPYVLDDVAWAEKHGYGSDLQRAVARSRTTDPNQHYFRSLGPERRAAALEAAHGARPVGVTARTPDGMVLTRSDQGCQSEADRTLYGDLTSWFQARSTVEALPEMARARVLADPRFAEATRHWARCMRAAGHAYESPAEIRAALPPPGRPLPREREVRLAVAEAKCAHSSGLAGTAKRLDQKFGSALRQKYRSDVNTLHRLQLAALSRARPITNGADTKRGTQENPASTKEAERENR